MIKKLLMAAVIVLFTGGCLFNFTLEDLQDENLEKLKIETKTNEAGEIDSIDITVETKEEAIAEAVGEAIKEGTSTLPTTETE